MVARLGRIHVGAGFIPPSGAGPVTEPPSVIVRGEAPKQSRCPEIRSAPPGSRSAPPATLRSVEGASHILTFDDIE